MVQNKSFKKIPFTDFVFFQEGPGLRTTQWVNDGMKVINVKNIYDDGTVDISNSDKFISLNEFEEKYSHFAVEVGDIVVASSGNTYGKVGRVFQQHLPLMMNTSVIRFHSADRSQLNDEYLYAFLRSPLFKAQIEQFVTGGAQPNFGPTHLKRMWITAPSISVQTKIAENISAYDSLIKNNQQRIKLLELSARQMYKEWFVRLRFPGYEHTKIIKCVPEGWVKGTAFDFIDVLSGGTPKTGVSDYWNGGIAFYTPKDSADNFYVIETDKTLSELGLSKCNSKLYPKDTIFITARGTVGNLNLAQRPMAMNQSCYAMKGKDDVTQLFLFCAIDAAINQFKQRASGAVFDAIIVDTFKLIPFLKPTKKFVLLFEEMMRPAFLQIENLLIQNQKLKQARDLLLPKLMSGEITV